ncbi:MAG: SDR family NAD(P)-dependent oxidoreductase [Betaproteobacteria bacterium]|nr:SDR family NAD(P)-dependent oxidoreductase [Betaproteobacteria bacterium]
MDLGIRGKNALVCAASKGLGRGCAMLLARKGVNVTIVARGREALEQTAAEIRSATRRSSASCARTSAAPRPRSSPGRTSSSTRWDVSGDLLRQGGRMEAEG